MRLKQGQVWKKDGMYYRIMERARLSVAYREVSGPSSMTGPRHEVTKKEFCRLIKGAELLPVELVGGERQPGGMK